ncbi:MAG TPA: S-methyl-5'-thioadenosine phosphorylase, partial [Acidobacteriaceae bacterium]
TFFGPDIVAHVSMADPVCPEVGNAMMTACGSSDVQASRGGTYVCMEGPQFSTKAESNLYRSWGADIIGMTNLQEAKLSREAEICYGTLAMVTDYDCWHPGHGSVTTDQIVAVLNQNNASALKVLTAAVAALPAKRSCHCQSALKDAILTRPSVISVGTRQKLRLLLDKYLKTNE